MKTLITGGNGFLARNLNKLLTAEGYMVVAPSRQELDMTNLSQYFSYLSTNKPDAIIHAAVRGGASVDKDTYEDFIANVTMYENLVIADPEDRPTILIGSGAEFDRRFDIHDACESEVFDCWPVDFYGMAKNQITKRALNGGLAKPYVLRLFGCFSEDEDEFRFIKRSILRLKQGLPIEIHQNREMDFFYVEDVARVIDHLLKYGGRDHINLVYPEKHDLLEIASLIHKHTNIFEPIIQLNKFGVTKSYTGDGTWLKSMGIPLIGLEEGIKRTCKALL